MIERPHNIENLNRGLVELESYKNSDINLDGWELTTVLYDTLFVQYADVSADGREVKRGSLYVPIDAVNFAWRIGKVILAGTDCKVVKQGDHVMFPNDKGIKAANINGISNVIFLSESRIFGVVKPTE